MTPEFKFSEELCRVDEESDRHFMRRDRDLESLVGSVSLEKDRVRAFDLEKVDRERLTTKQLEVID